MSNSHDPNDPAYRRRVDKRVKDLRKDAARLRRPSKGGCGRVVQNLLGVLAIGVALPFLAVAWYVGS